MFISLGESEGIESKLKSIDPLGWLTEGDLLFVPAAVTRGLKPREMLSLIMIDGMVAIMSISCISICIFSFFSPVCQLKIFNSLFLLAEAPINCKIFTFLSVGQQNNQMISVCVSTGAVTASTYFCQKPTFSLHEAETAAFQTMDYDQFDKDFCQCPTLSDGVAT